MTTGVNILKGPEDPPSAQRAHPAALAIFTEARAHKSIGNAE
jgi:hypothetical protein